MTSRRNHPIIMGNWKMYKTRDEALEFVKNLGSMLEKPDQKAYLAVPFTYIDSLSKAIDGKQVVIGGQNMNAANEGAFTGEIAARMLLDVGAKFVLIGHSERRTLYKETDEEIRKKVRRAVDDGLPPVLCVGETLEQHEAGEAKEVIRHQLTMDLEGVTKEEMANVTIAYEPVWAIGTGKAATPEIAQETQAHCRKVLEGLFGKEIGDGLPILYGGSVKPENAKQLLEKPDIDGLLIGGASLSLASFSEIVNHSS